MSDEEEPKKLPFDKELARKFQDLSGIVMLDHPELRSVAVVFDYVGDLNDGGASRGIWIGDDGAVQTLEGIHGSISQTLRILEMMFVRAQQISDQMRNDAAVIGQELVKRRQALEALRGEENTDEGPPAS